jgi:hypothetical protein
MGQLAYSISVGGSSGSKEMTDYEGAWVYPRYLHPRSVRPGPLTSDVLSSTECFRQLAEQVAHRCENRIDPRSVIQKRAAKHLVSP